MCVVAPKIRPDEPFTSYQRKQFGLLRFEFPTVVSDLFIASVSKSTCRVDASLLLLGVQQDHR